MKALRRKLFVAALAVGLPLAAFLLVLRGSPFPKRPALQLPVRAGGVTLTQIEDRLVGSTAVSGQRGDFLLSSDGVKLVVAAADGAAERHLRLGAIVDLVAHSFSEDALVELRPVVYAGTTALPMRVDSVTPLDLATRPGLRVVQSSNDGALLAQTEIRLFPKEPFVQLITRLDNTGPVSLRAVRIGDRVAWPGAHTFAPRLGHVRFTTRAEVPWIGRRGHALSYALAFLDGPAEVHFLFDRVGPTSQVALGSAVDLAPGGHHEHRRRLIVVPGGLGRAAGFAWRALGRKIGYIRGELKPVPSWGQIEAQHADGKPVLIESAAADGSYELALPEGNYRLVLRAPGGEDAQQVSVTAGKTREVRLLPPEPGRLRYSARDEHGHLLPVRLIVQGIGDTKTPDFGPVESAAGARNITYARRGEGELELPAGHYRVTATHGVEYDVYQEDIGVTAAAGAAVRATLERRVPTPGWVACDFHVHAAPSPDSDVSLEDRVVALLAEGVEFAVAADHNHVTDYDPTLRQLEAGSELRAASGVEITTQTWGHFIAFPYPKGANAPPYVGVEPAEIFAAVRARAPGAVIQVNHPRMRGIGYFNRIELDPRTGIAATDGFSFDFDTLEVLNGFELGDQKRMLENLSEWFLLLNMGRRYTAVGNSDSHRLAFQWAGYPRTYVRVLDDHPGAVTATEIARSLMGGRAVVTNGPFVVALVDGAGGPGDTVNVSDRRVTLQVAVRAPRWIDIKRADVWVNGMRVATTTRVIPGDSTVRIQWEVELKINQDAWLVVVVSGDRPMDLVLPGANAKPFAFTNPIFIDVDGDGIASAPGLTAVDAGVVGPAASSGREGSSVRAAPSR